MKILSRIANIIDPTHKNSMGDLTGKEYLKYGGKPMYQDWSRLIMSEPDKYTGILFGIINKRANLVAQLALDCLKTDAADQLMQAAKKRGEALEHPYLTVIDESLNFSNYDFWFNCQTYVDLRGIAYVGVIRTVQDGRIGDVMDFELLNPYKTERVTKNTNGRVEVGGYREYLEGGYWRDWPPEQVIVIKRLNPFDPNEPYSMSDAGKDSQFTIKQADDYTRHSLNANANAPGIISTDVLLDNDMFELFKARVNGTEKGRPIIANGKGAVTWQSMQIEMDKAALDKIHQVSLEHLLAVSATSKTSLGIEQSGVTRDTAKVMRDQMTSDAGIPGLTFIIEALNQDYKRYYPDEYKKNQYRLWIDSPLKTDREAEGKDIENRTAAAELFQSMVNKGYDHALAAKYAAGEISLEDMGKPKNPPVQPVLPGTDPSQVPDPKAKPKDDPKPKNALATNDVAPLTSQEASLQTTIGQIEEQVALAVLSKVAKNTYDDASDVIDPKDQSQQERALFNALIVFYNLLVPLQAAAVMRNRTNEYGKAGTFSMDTPTRTAVDDAATAAAASHIQTIVEDLRQTVRQTMVAEGDIGRIAPAVRP